MKGILNFIGWSLLFKIVRLAYLLPKKFPILLCQNGHLKVRTSWIRLFSHEIVMRDIANLNILYFHTLLLFRLQISSNLISIMNFDGDMHNGILFNFLFDYFNDLFVRVSFLLSFLLLFGHFYDFSLAKQSHSKKGSHINALNKI